MTLSELRPGLVQVPRSLSFVRTLVVREGQFRRGFAQNTLHRQPLFRASELSTALSEQEEPDAPIQVHSVFVVAFFRYFHQTPMDVNHCGCGVRLLFLCQGQEMIELTSCLRSLI